MWEILARLRSGQTTSNRKECFTRGLRRIQLCFVAFPDILRVVSSLDAFAGRSGKKDSEYKLLSSDSEITPAVTLSLNIWPREDLESSLQVFA